jgi:hypothetical protein
VRESVFKHVGPGICEKGLRLRRVIGVTHHMTLVLGELHFQFLKAGLMTPLQQCMRG